MFTSVGCVVGLWSTTHTSGGDRSCKWSKHPTEVCLHAEMQRVCTCYTTEITIHCYTAKITLCLLVRDSYVTALCISTGWLLVLLKNLRFKQVLIKLWMLNFWGILDWGVGGRFYNWHLRVHVPPNQVSQLAILEVRAGGRIHTISLLTVGLPLVC